MKRVFYLLSILLQGYGVVAGRGQIHSTNHYLGYSIGGIQAKEENLIPKVHSGAIHCFTYSLEVKKDVYQFFEFQFGYGSPTTEIGNDAGSWNGQLLVGYSLNFRIHEGNPITYYFGPRVGFTSSLSEYQTWDEAHAYWGNCLSLAASNVLIVDLDSARSFVVRLDASLLSLTARPDQHRLYSNEYWTFSNIITITNRGYQFGTWDHAFQLRASAEYRTPILGSLALSLSCSLYYSRLRADVGNPLKEIISKVGIGIWL